MNFDEFKSKLELIFNDRVKESLNLVFDENYLSFDFDDVKYTYTREEYDSLYDVSKIYLYKDVSIYTPYEYEIMVTESNHPFYDRATEMEPIIDN